eukprot:g6668.t1
MAAKDQHGSGPGFTPPGEPLDPVATVLRTPDARFADLPDFPFRAHYITSEVHGSVRIHFLDEGPRGAETILLMHGEPTWCYLYRHMIPILVEAGYRVLAPDLVGFGKSDKPARREDYSYERQVDWMADWLVQVRVFNCTAFVQDWGGLIGLRLVARFPERFARVVVSNTGLPAGGGQMGKAFKAWALKISQQVPAWSMMVSATCRSPLPEASAAAYDAPFPSERFKAATRVFPRLVPQSDDHMSVEENAGAWRRVFARWRRPLLTLFSADDPVSRGGEAPWKEHVPGARGQAHEIVPDAGHFIQEDQPRLVCERLLAFVRATPNPWARAPGGAARL